MIDMTKPRCDWGTKVDDRYTLYHDQEWGVPVHDDRKQFEFLTLEGAQAGLSWWTILSRREGYRKAFANFDPQKIARFTEKRVEKLLQNKAIIRNRLKVKAAVTNAQAFLAVQDAFDSFDNYLWQFVDGKTIQNKWRSMKQMPANTPLSDKISKDLKQRGFKFVGSTIVYSHLQAAGLINDHLVKCFRHQECAKMR